MRKFLYIVVVATFFVAIGLALHIIQYLNKYHNYPMFMKPSVWNFKKVWQPPRNPEP